MSEFIVGLNIGNHDSAACLLKDGLLVSYAEQERFSRRKMALGEAPIDALKFCLDKNEITLKDVSGIAIGMDWNYRNNIYQEPELERKKYQDINSVDIFLPRSVFGDCRPEIHYIRHHLSHASSAYSLSGFEDAAILVIDNRGEDVSTSLGYAENGIIKFFKTIGIESSLGGFYNSACRYTGLYGRYREVGKFMGLASYGMPLMRMPITENRKGSLYSGLSEIENKSIYETILLRKQQLQDYFKENCYPYESGNKEDIMSYANFAASAQSALEAIIIDFANELKEKTNSKNLVIAGGVALNCSANGKIEQSNIFDNIFIPPFASDAGTSIGAAFELDKKMYARKHCSRMLCTASLGASYTNEDAILALEKYANEVDWEIISDGELCEKVAEELVSGKVVCWMQGSFEAGPRALGNRSIIADPRIRKNHIRLNNIKKREMWRPIAPSVLYEHYDKYFSGTPNNKYFMNFAVNVHVEQRKYIPAVVHVDGSARPQVVTKDNYKYYKLIREFYEKTGVPMVCNTSFNIQGEPLVNTPEDAIKAFLTNDFDLLVIENIIIKKSDEDVYI